MDPLRSKVVVSALTSRLVLIVACIVADAIMPNYPSDVFKWVQSSNSAEGAVTVCDKLVNVLLGGLVRWDAHYFLHVADNGYTYENTLAFFPLYPILVRALAEVVYWCQVEYGLIRFNSALILAAVGVNVAAFVAAAVALHELSRKVLRDEYLAYKSALFFCFNPASIFFTAPYSEAIHSALSFMVMLKVEKGFTFQMGLFLAASATVRSNGLLNLGFVVYKGLKIIAKELAIHHRLVQLKKTELSTTIANIVGDGCVPTLFSVVAAVVPFAVFQWYGFTQFCGLTKEAESLSDDLVGYANERGYKLPSSPPSEWCGWMVPASYNYIQKHHWNVGFLNYFEIKQIPNFVIAAPILYLVLSQSYAFFQHHKYYCLRLGFTHFGMDPAQRVPTFDHYAVRGLPRDCFVYVVHAAVLAVLGIFCFHVQISTRMLCSSCPVIYWWAAMLSSPRTKTKPVPIFPNKNHMDVVLKLESVTNLESGWKNLLVDEYTEQLSDRKSGYRIISSLTTSLEPFCFPISCPGLEKLSRLRYLCRKIDFPLISPLTFYYSLNFPFVIHRYFIYYT